MKQVKWWYSTPGSYLKKWRVFSQMFFSECNLLFSTLGYTRQWCNYLYHIFSLPASRTSKELERTNYWRIWNFLSKTGSICPARIEAALFSSHNCPLKMISLINWSTSLLSLRPILWKRHNCKFYKLEIALPYDATS